MNRPPYVNQMPPPPPPPSQMIASNAPPPPQTPSASGQMAPCGPMAGQASMRPVMANTQQSQQSVSATANPQRPPMQYPNQPQSGPSAGTATGNPYPGPAPIGPPRYPMHQVRMGQPMSAGSQSPYGPPAPNNRPPIGPMGPSHPTHGSPMPSTGVKRPAPGMMNQSPAGPSLKPGMVPVGPPNTLAPGAPNSAMHGPVPKKKKKISDRVLPQKVRDLVPESQAYMDLLSFERKLDFTIQRKRVEYIECLKRPMKQKRRLRIFVSSTYYPSKNDLDIHDEPSVPSWELRVEGRLLDDKGNLETGSSKGSTKRKFSTFFKSLVIELDKDLYGPDNHLVEWHRSQATNETDGFQVKRPGNKNVRCQILFLLDHHPLQFKLEQRLARLLGIHTNTRSAVASAFWQYVKTHQLQDTHEREYINCDRYLEHIFGCSRFKFSELPNRLSPLLLPAEAIQINHVIQLDPQDPKKSSMYDIDVEVDDPVKSTMNNFVMNTCTVQELNMLDQKMHETVDTISQIKTTRDFFLGFANDPQQFIHKWVVSQVRDLKVMSDEKGNSEEERMSDFFYQPWTQEAVCRYFYGKIQQRRAELEQALGIRNA